MGENLNLPANKPVLEVAREALLLLGAQRVPPTPEAYKKAYYEIAGTSSPVMLDKRVVDELRGLLNRTLTLGLTSLLHDAPDLAAEAFRLGEELQTTESEKRLDGLNNRLSDFCMKIEMKGANSAQKQDALLRLFKLLLNNVGDLLDDDAWLKGQLETVLEMTSGPISVTALEELETSLKDVIYKQGVLKQSLNDAKDSIKELLNNFVERLDHMTQSTGNYHDRITLLTEQINSTSDVDELTELLESVKLEASSIQAEALDSLNQISASQSSVENAESRIKFLESRLEEVSELVREDMLTGSLNRRGMEDAFTREIARANRNGTSLCAAFLDLDDFRSINEQYGHFAGDDALVHMVRTVKRSLRASDFIARYGGDEFLLIFPETEEADAVNIMQRIQRELTKHFFMYKKQRILVTFSAGVCMHVGGDAWEVVANRANQAMLAAKKAGKNRVFSFDPSQELIREIVSAA